jgi:hypothetical protein
VKAIEFRDVSRPMATANVPSALFGSTRKPPSFWLKFDVNSIARASLSA